MKRKNVVLKAMFDCGYILNETYLENKNKNVEICLRKNNNYFDDYIRAVKLELDDAFDFADDTGCVSLVCVDVHSCSELVGNADDDITECQCAAVAVCLNRDDLLVLNAHSSSVFGCDVQVAHSSDDALCQLDFALGANQLAGACACDVAALTDGSLNADSASIGQRDLDLGSLTLGAEDGDAGESALCAFNADLLFACKLAGLGQILLLCQLVAFAEQDVDVLSGQMDVTSRCFDDNFIHGYLLQIRISFYWYGLTYHNKFSTYVVFFQVEWHIYSKIPEKVLPAKGFSCPMAQAAV